MNVKLTWFKHNGKFYSDSEYETQETDLWKIWQEVEAMQAKDGNGEGQLPSEFIYLVDVPVHPHNHPHLVM